MNEEDKKNEFTEKERELLRGIKENGYYPKVMAPKLDITVNTFNTHIRNVHKKTNTHNPAELMKYIYDHPSALNED